MVSSVSEPTLLDDSNRHTESSSVLETLSPTATANNTTFAMLQEFIRLFCAERDWDQFHGAKDLAVGLITESAELLEHFRFKSEEEIAELFRTPDKLREIRHELVDSLYFILRFAQRYDIDLVEAFREKMAINATKYPVRLAKGKNLKSNELHLAESTKV